MQIPRRTAPRRSCMPSRGRILAAALALKPATSVKAHATTAARSTIFFGILVTTRPRSRSGTSVPEPRNTNSTPRFVPPEHPPYRQSPGVSETLDLGGRPIRNPLRACTTQACRALAMRYFGCAHRLSCWQRSPRKVNGVRLIDQDAVHLDFDMEVVTLTGPSSVMVARKLSEAADVERRRTRLPLLHWFWRPRMLQIEGGCNMGADLLSSEQNANKLREMTGFLHDAKRRRGPCRQCGGACGHCDLWLSHPFCPWLAGVAAGGYD